MRKSFLTICAAAFLTAGAATAADKPMMHCFIFTPITSATDADWKAFYDATAKLPSGMKGIVNHVWYGKMRRPLTVGDAKREYGVCMEMSGPDALAKYTKSPAHDTWMKAYEKVRVAGTTTYDLIAP